MNARRVLKPLLPPALCALYFAAPLLAQEEEWSVEESRAPAITTLDFVATEGTWMSLDVSPDGSTLTFDLLGHIYEMPIDGGQARALTDGRSWNMFPRYSPDGSSLAFTSDRSGSEDIWILHLAADSLENLSEMDLPVVQGSWSADGTALYGSALTQEATTEGYRFNFYGGKQTIATAGVFEMFNHFEEHAGRQLIFYEHNDQQLHRSGARIRTYDIATGETDVYRERPGGAFNPALSPDGRYLAYGHRDDQETVLVLHDLETKGERTLVRGLDRDHQEYRPYYYGVSPNVAWHPDGDEIFLAFGGGIHAVNIESGDLRHIPFQARVQRELDATIRFPVEVPEERTRALTYRWAHRIDQGILFESLGDIYLAARGNLRNLTASDAHETSPVYDPISRNLYYAAWTDDDLGGVYRQPLSGGTPRRLTSRRSQYSSLALAPGGSTLAFVRGTGDLEHGGILEGQTEFELVVIDRDEEKRKVTDISGTGNFSSRLPLTVVFGPDGEHLYYTEFLSDTLTLQRIGLDGTEKTALYRFPHAVRQARHDEARG
jgi:Tol biopolymer transport system component